MKGFLGKLLKSTNSSSHWAIKTVLNPQVPQVLFVVVSVFEVRFGWQRKVVRALRG
jgi:hypothetical protein